MTSIVSQRGVISALILLLVAAACAWRPSSPNAPDSAEPQGPVRLQVPTGPGAFSLADRTAGLDALSSYTATLVRSFDGTVSGAANRWSHTIILMRTHEPAVRLMTFSSTGDVPAGGGSLLAEFDNVTYEIGADGRCRADPGGGEAERERSYVEMMEPAAQLHSVFGAESAGQETVNGVPAERYTFDQRALVDRKVLEASGEIWMASEGAYLLKYVLTLKGDAGYFGEGTEGTLTLEYALSDVNNTPVQELPAECRVDAPLLADATDVTMLPGWVRYASATGVSDAASFYGEQLPGLGWSADGEPLFDEAGTMLIYARGGKRLFVAIDPAPAGGIFVDLTEGTAAE